MPTAELAYFGIMPEFIGMGLGPYLLGQALDMLWHKEPARVLVNTCTLDHPKALPLYQRFGFRPYDQQKVPAPWQDVNNVLDFA
jgi:predicted N-acetyltransferase YhbS